MRAILSPDVEQLILDRVRTGEYGSADEVVRRGLALLEKTEKKTQNVAPTDTSDLSAVFERISSDVPDVDWQKVPVDLSTNLDHYLYGAQKTS
ncbi:MAG: type II toxin-antitoxin system ParD family antitoxin [Silvibacterium sp.]|nr:type II toxin-antitoxin system ParD family antitoxin [Silvibacterium sp.]